MLLQHALQLLKDQQMFLQEDNMDIHETLISLFNTYQNENEKASTGNKSAGTRARKALSEISKLCKERRKEIQQTKNS